MRIPSALPTAPPPPSGGAASSAAPDPPGTMDAQRAVMPNPTLRIEPALGLVVLEFRDQHGEAQTIPSERELEAYRNAARGIARPGDQISSPPAGNPNPGSPTGVAAEVPTESR